MSDYYASLTPAILKKRPHALTFHRGLWGPDTKSDQEALERSDRTLVQGCDLVAGQHVLDSGCGLGGTAIALAERHGVRVTGLTNCTPHVALAARKAEDRGVADLVEFVHGDFMSLPFPDACFDVVLNQESFVYTANKPAYLQGVFRVLRPGGRWQSLEGEILSGFPISEAHLALRAVVERNWLLPPLVSWLDVLDMLKQSGFECVREQDLSAEALPSSQEIRRAFLTISFLNPEIRELNPAFQAHMDASIGYAEGLSEGLFTYRFFSATKPG